MMLKSEAAYCGKGFDREVREILIGLNIEGRRAARQGDLVLLDGKEVGRVTSGSFGPSVGHAIALAYVQADKAEAVNFQVKGALASLNATRADLPFYKNGTARIKLT
jgi:aminomethyltransferase